MAQKAIDIPYSPKMTQAIARYLLDHQDDVRRYIESTPEKYKQFCEEWEKTHGKEATNAGT